MLLLLFAEQKEYGTYTSLIGYFVCLGGAFKLPPSLSFFSPVENTYKNGISTNNYIHSKD